MPISKEKANPKEEPSFILASGSPRRKDLLGDLLSEFSVQLSSAVELKSHPGGPLALVRENARMKASEVADGYPQSWVLGADTLVWLEDRIYGKPKNMEEAHSMLGELSGKTHSVSTGLCLIHKELAYDKTKVDTTRVTFLPFAAEEREEYFRYVDPLDKAGAYAMQTQADLIIESFEGSRSNVIGLPLPLLRDWLAEFGLI
ncbi:MAG: Maf family protein [Verrucomicrobiota bacterium]|nr:Maf family protein [Verrucomicrobiota bacterium]